VLRLPTPCVVVLVGAPGSGKSSWAEQYAGTDRVVSSDRLRAVVGDGEHDVSATADAFEVLDLIVRRRVARRLTTVIDTVGFDDVARSRWRELAAATRMPCFAITFDVQPAVARERNRGRDKRVPDSVLTGQLRRWPSVLAQVGAEPFAAVFEAEPAEFVPAALAGSEAKPADSDAGHRLRFGLQIPSFQFDGGPAVLASRLASLATAAEEAGFEHLWVMDHFRQIPMFGPAWHDAPESYTTLAYLAACTSRLRLGTLVTGITYRNIAHLGKIVATLDVLSGGRAMCGLGLAWLAQEHAAYGWPFPPVADRYAMLEDALQLLPLLWGPGAPRFEGRTITVAEAMCYPRPRQERIPIWVGGSGERRTLRLVARYAQACNLFGEVPTVRAKVGWLHRHCDEVGRPREDVEVSQLSTVLVGRDRSEVERLVDALKPARSSAERFAQRVNAGTVEQHISRFEALAGAGVQTAVVSMADLDALDGEAAIARFTPIVDHFR
jgi:F420-dependent oxidoreductase-like protein